MDNGIGDTFVSGVREEASFALIDFEDWQDREKAGCLGQEDTFSRYQGMGNTMVQLSGLGCSGRIETALCRPILPRPNRAVGRRRDDSLWQADPIATCEIW